MNIINIEDSTLQVDINEATIALKENRFTDALKMLEINLSKYPDHIDSLYLAAVASRYLKKFDASETYILSLLKYAPDMGRAYQELGHLKKSTGNDEEAISNFRQACELNPALVGSWKALHELFKSNDNKLGSDHALEQFNRYIKLPKTLLYIDQIMNEDRLGLAEIKCREFLKKFPTHTYAMSQLAEIASRLGHYNDAEYLLEQATIFEPNNPDLRMKYLMVLRKTQKFIKTSEQVDILCEKFPNNPIYELQKAIELMQNGRNSDAIDMLNHIIKKSPNNFSALTSRGHAEKTLGKTDDAINSYQQAYKIKPNHGEAFFLYQILKLIDLIIMKLT